jgi:hypothetical protein
MYVKPSKNSPAAIRKAKYLAEQKARNEAAKKAVIASIKKG